MIKSKKVSKTKNKVKRHLREIPFSKIDLANLNPGINIKS